MAQAQSSQFSQLLAYSLAEIHATSHQRQRAVTATARPSGAEWSTRSNFVLFYCKGKQKRPSEGFATANMLYLTRLPLSDLPDALLMMS
jgi:hypothetical protein